MLTTGGVRFFHGTPRCICFFLQLTEQEKDIESSGSVRVGSQDTEDTKRILLINDRVDFTTHESGNKICLKGRFTLICCFDS